MISAKSYIPVSLHPSRLESSIADSEPKIYYDLHFLPRDPKERKLKARWSSVRSVEPPFL